MPTIKIKRQTIYTYLCHRVVLKPQFNFKKIDYFINVVIISRAITPKNVISHRYEIWVVINFV